MLSSVDKSGMLSSYNIIIFTLTLISVSLIPYLMGLLGRFYCIGVLIIGCGFFGKEYNFTGLDHMTLREVFCVHPLFTCLL